MAAQPCPQLVSYEEYVPVAAASELDVELHFGQVVTRQWAGMRHVALRHRIQDLLESALGSSWKVLAGMPYRALPQYEGRNADVGVVSAARWKEALKVDYLTGSPEIVIEILSRRSKPETSALCLGTGVVQFWAVDDQNSTVTVITASGTNVFTASERIPLGIADGSLAVDEMFA